MGLMVFHRGRDVREITFQEADVINIGQLRAFDFFGDGSFYLLDTPGHAVGHLGGLARTTSDTFVFMGGDLCHHAGELRPSELLPLPANIYSSAFTYRGGVCPGAEFEELQNKRSRSTNGPFFDPAMGLDIPTAIETIRKVQEADAEDNVFFIYAHDATIKGTVDFFPAYANEWKQKDWSGKVHWKFLEDFKLALGAGEKK
jgi:glyoxylase-like metal-dependent hydrolase (beta-lactamase superfamily II)